MQQYGSTDTTRAWNKTRFISSEIRFTNDWQPVNSGLGLSYAIVHVTFSIWDVSVERGGLE